MLVLTHVFPHDHVHAAGLDLQRAEDDARGGRRLRARSDNAGVYSWSPAGQVLHPGDCEQLYFDSLLFSIGVS